MTATRRDMTTATAARTSVDKLYDAVKDMSVAYRLKPGSRLNEVELAKSLGASRTPLREALNRLVAERLLDFRPGRGFFCRALDATEVFELYEVRRMLEVEAVKLVCARAPDAAITAIRDDPSLYDWRMFGQPIQELVAKDEAFHMQVAALGGNGELVHQLRRINERIRFVRWLDMDKRVQDTKAEHKAIIKALVARDEDVATGLMRAHIERRLDQIDAVVREGFSTIYMNDLHIGPVVEPGQPEDDGR